MHARRCPRRGFGSTQTLNSENLGYGQDESLTSIPCPHILAHTFERSYKEGLRCKLPLKRSFFCFAEVMNIGVFRASDSQTYILFPAFQWLQRLHWSQVSPHTSFYQHRRGLVQILTSCKRLDGSSWNESQDGSTRKFLWKTCSAGCLRLAQKSRGVWRLWVGSNCLLNKKPHVSGSRTTK